VLHVKAYVAEEHMLVLD